MKLFVIDQRYSRLAIGLLMILILITAVHAGFAGQTSKTDSIWIYGKILPKRTLPEGSFFKCKVVQRHALDTWVGYTTIYRIPVINREFRMSLPVKDPYLYATLQLEYPDGHIELLNFDDSSWECPLLFQPGDSLALRIGLDKHLSFSGKGAEKLKAQKNIYEMGSLPSGTLSRLTELENANAHQQTAQYLEQSTRSSLKLKLELLESYRSNLNSTTFNQLKYDVIGRHQYAFYWKLLLSRQIDQGKFVPFTKAILQRILKASPDSNRSIAAVNSIHYANAQMLLERLRQQYHYSSDPNFQALDFPAMTQHIRQNYSPAIREKILMLAYLELSAKPGVIAHLEKQLPKMDPGFAREFLQQWYATNYQRSAAYPFSLTDEHGKQQQLKDFKGKVLLMDFWFNGCIPCVAMAKALRPLTAHYQNHPDVIFLSVNVDEKEKLWRSALVDGKYHVPGALNLSIHGNRREEHPLLKHYNINGFPQLLLIDQQGRLVSSNPPSPLVDRGEGLMQLIDSLLERSSSR